MELNPRLGRLACYAGGWRFGLHEFEEALALHERSIRLTPDRCCPYFCTAMIYVNRDGTTERAREFLQRIPPELALEGNPPIAYPWIVLEMVDGRYEEALQRLESGATEVLEFGDFYLPRELVEAEIYGLMNHPEIERSRYEAALQKLEVKVRDAPEDDRVHSSLGLVYAGLNRREDAVREGLRAMELQGGSPDEHFGYRLRDLIQIYVMVGEQDKAIDEVERLLSNPGFWSARFLRIDPTLQALRGDPRFEALLQKYDPSEPAAGTPDGSAQTS